MYQQLVKEEAMNLKRHQEWCMEEFVGRKGIGKLCNYITILKIKILNYICLRNHT